jgi:hypothetical protein
MPLVNLDVIFQWECTCHQPDSPFPKKLYKAREQNNGPATFCLPLLRVLCFLTVSLYLFVNGAL